MLEVEPGWRVEWGGRAGVFEEREERAGQLVERASMCGMKLERRVVDAVRSVGFVERGEWAEWASGVVDVDEKRRMDTERAQRFLDDFERAVRFVDEVRKSGELEEVDERVGRGEEVGGMGEKWKEVDGIGDRKSVV